jgi:hypothetical protein
MEARMTHQIKTYKGKKYFVLPTLKPGSCDGCVFHDRDERYEDGALDCPHNDTFSVHNEACTGGFDTITDLLWIPPTQKAMAEYIARKLGDTDEMG